ncbi:RNA polymerase sigma factor [Luteimonas sp. Y-2-2-4F]|nr:RNA polymerase sigma factor [Luteimonas sp. Y-2-2-4F]MCD9030550.1 RNA polymerase sigma factor [Luteimonas sp. Y-2-2-4F]
MAGQAGEAATQEDIWGNWEQDRIVLRCRAIRLTRGNVDEAEDILSSTVLKTLDYLRQHRAQIRRPRAFLLFALNNEFVSRCRRRAQENAQLDRSADVEEQAGATAAPGHEQALQVQETLAAVMAEVARLPSDQRRLFRMRFREERSYADIAQAFGISQPLARKRVQLLRERLRRAPGVSD